MRLIYVEKNTPGVQAFCNVVDSFYVSRISESAVTALELAFPIQNLMIGCAVA